MNFQVLSERRTGTRESLLEQQRVEVNEAKRHEFREAPRFLLNFAEEQ